jgi:hypothetical protein
MTAAAQVAIRVIFRKAGVLVCQPGGVTALILILRRNTSVGIMGRGRPADGRVKLMEGSERLEETVREAASPDVPPGATDGRRELTIVVLTIVVFAGLALLASSRTWTAEVGPDQIVNAMRDRTGAERLPALPALALVALAGAGALVACRGRARTAVSVLVVLSGLGIAALVLGSIRGAEGGPFSWPSLAFVSGIMITGMGLRALLHGSRYPSMGTRYEREARRAGGTADDDLWTAIDRGEDPTRDPRRD